MHANLPRTIELLHRGINEGLHAGAQLYVSLREEPIANVAVGRARPDAEMTPETINHWLSSGKPITAVAVAQQWEPGRLDLDDAVAKQIPEFAANGKERVTIRHILTHTAGFRGFLLNFDRPVEDVLASLYNERLEPRWLPGRQAGYHPASSWFVLAEIVRRLDDRHRTFDRYAREMIFEPLGMRDSFVGMPPDRFAAYEAERRIGYAYDTSAGPPDDAKVRRVDDHAVGAVNPGANLRGTASDLGRFYEVMLAKGAIDDAGAHLLTPQSVDAMTARHRAGMYDRTFNRIVDFGLGFIIDSKQYKDPRHATEPNPPPPPYGYGPHASPRTFGHSGAQSSSAFADPEYGLAVAWVCNGRPGEARHQARQHAINGAIYEDLDLARAGLEHPPVEPKT
jgi:CubicO group peptidase (beta-lactamase class C family)